MTDPATDPRTDTPPGAPADHRWPTGVVGLGYGGDYNPEQWPLETQLEDVELMQQAGVNLVSVAIFAWATIEPREGEYHFDWLDDVLDRLHAAGIRVALATATASPPPWLTARHPEILPRLADGTVLWQGGRQAYSVTHPVFRRYATAMAARIAERYADHPALALWHIDNEIGCHVPRDYSDAAAAAFRDWLRARYGTVDALNDAWGTAFWSQRYGDVADVLPPFTAPTYPNPTQQLDFDRFSSDAMLDYYRDLRDAVRQHTPHVPVTTNFMTSTSTKGMDYFGWAREVDVVATDHYTVAADEEREVELALSADLTRGVARGRPWILMEHSTSAVNWQPRNRPKAPGEMLRNSLAHVARGADSVMFFQWRQSVAGAEKYHSAMVPHAGTDSEVWRGTLGLGRALEALAEVRGSRVRADVALVFDYEAWWAVELDSHPSVDVTYVDRMRAYHRELWRRGVTVDVVEPGADLTGYRLVLVPTLYLVRDEHAAAITRAAEDGATVVVTYFSGIVDEHDHVRPGGYPGAFRELLGVRTEEFAPLLAGEQVALDDGTSVSVWTEKVHLAGATAVRTLASGPLAGTPALTRRTVGSGAAWYEAARLDDVALSRLVDALLGETRVQPAAAAPPGVEVVRRHGEQHSYLFVLNHTDAEHRVPADGTDLLTGTTHQGEVPVPAWGAVVVREG
ncbi:beta-galactosidase [Georgenia sp. H159]|uniref:beta-galactosidase n=1 Tax=Georgenia sp. H159 TaxID=3076115 RepID=UPI002D78D306|nr:beta-galactosidase [Georgenia sp. H159]